MTQDSVLPGEIDTSSATSRVAAEQRASRAVSAYRVVSGPLSPGCASASSVPCVMREELLRQGAVADARLAGNQNELTAPCLRVTQAVLYVDKLFLSFEQAHRALIMLTTMG